MKAQKYYKLVPNTGEQQLNYLFEFEAVKRSQIQKRINYGKKHQPPYLLIERTQQTDSTEAYTDIKAIYHEIDLLKAIKNNTCFDYSGMTIIVWAKGEAYSWETYKKLIG